MFSCSPNCTFSQLSISEWSVLFIFFVMVLFFTSHFKKWAFKERNLPKNKLSWHLPKLLFIAYVLFFLTVPLLWAIFGYLVVKLYGITVFPMAVFVIYTLLPDNIETNNHENN